LRLARKWSQEEVAVRMTAYGYDFHQTMIAKIEAAQRPLRVRELADFAALYGVEVQDLVHPPTGSLEEVEQEIAEVTLRCHLLQGRAVEARQQLEAAREAMQHAEVAYQGSTGEIAVLDSRLAALQAQRDKLISWGSGERSSPAVGGEGEDRDVLKASGPSVASVSESPTVLRILLGAQLRQLREVAGITMDQAALEIRGSRPKVARLEMGRVAPKERDVVDLLTLYGVPGDEHETLRTLARQANAPGWWHKYSDVLPDWFEHYIGLEAAASRLSVYEVQFVPGLVQTEDYARAVTHLRHDNGSRRGIDREVQFQMARQAILDRPDPIGMRLILDEAALRRQVGGEAVMRRQFRHLADMADRQDIAIQLIPFGNTSRPVPGSFSLLEFDDPDLFDIVFSEHIGGGFYLDGAEGVDYYRRLMQRLAAQALPEDETRAFLRQLLR
jgi:transcriptional regulator with XRE-family HTH domain